MSDSISTWLYILNVSLPALAGGLVCFLLGVKIGNYKNNMFVKKCALELAGALLTASALCLVMQNIDINMFRVFAFLVGVCWASIIQALRSYITKKVETLLKKAG